MRRALREARGLIYVKSAQFARTARPTGQPTAEQVDLVGEIVTSLTAHPNLRVIICMPRESDFAANYPGWGREHYKARTEALSNLLAAASDRVAVFHPVGFPGRTAFIRTTSIIVDDVWCLSGATHFRRRGMTFDGSVAIASFDRQMDTGYSRGVRAYRRALMAAKMAIAAPGGRRLDAARAAAIGVRARYRLARAGWSRTDSTALARPFRYHRPAGHRRYGRPGWFKRCNIPWIICQSDCRSGQLTPDGPIPL